MGIDHDAIADVLMDERDALRSRLAEAEALLRECHTAIFADSWALNLTHRVMSFLNGAPDSATHRENANER